MAWNSNQELQILQHILKIFFQTFKIINMHWIYKNNWSYYIKTVQWIIFNDRQHIDTE